MNVEFNETEAYNKPDSEEVAYYKNAVDKERKELISFREKLKEAREKADKLEEVIRELIPIAEKCLKTFQYDNLKIKDFVNGIPSDQSDAIKAIIEKAKSLTT